MLNKQTMLQTLSTFFFGNLLFENHPFLPQCQSSWLAHCLSVSLSRDRHAMPDPDPDPHSESDSHPEPKAKSSARVAPSQHVACHLQVGAFVIASSALAASAPSPPCPKVHAPCSMLHASCCQLPLTCPYAKRQSVKFHWPGAPKRAGKRTVIRRHVCLEGLIPGGGDQLAVFA